MSIEDRENKMQNDLGYMRAKIEDTDKTLGDLSNFVKEHMKAEEKRFGGIIRWQYGLTALIILQWIGFTGPEALKIFVKILG